MREKDQSYRSKLWRNRTAVTCMVLLSILSLLALFAYVIIPDRSINANRQTPRVALSFPGYTQSFLLSKKSYSIEPSSWVQSMIKGKRDEYDYIPYDSLVLKDKQVAAYFEGTVQLVDYDRSVQLHLDDLTSVQKTFWMGTDKYGRDVLSRLILGLRASLIVGFLAVLVSLFIGITIGSIGGYYGGWIDKIVMLIINASWSIPTLLMAFAIIIALGKGFLVIILAVGLTMWVDVARIVRGQVMQVKSELFIKASNVLGYSDRRTILHHILPNITGPILVMAAANFATAILVEAGLSFLGVGIQPPTPSLGNMLQESYAYATGGFVYLAIFPILMIMTLVLCFNLLGTALRDVFDIRSQ